MKYKIDTILYTKDGRQIGNAIIAGKNNLTGDYIIRTDYGNFLQCSPNEIDEIFYTKQDEGEYKFADESHKYHSSKYKVIIEANGSIIAYPVNKS